MLEKLYEDHGATENRREKNCRHCFLKDKKCYNITNIMIGFPKDVSEIANAFPRMGPSKKSHSEREHKSMNYGHGLGLTNSKRGIELKLYLSNFNEKEFTIKWPMLNTTIQKGFFKEYITFFGSPIYSETKKQLNLGITPYWKIDESMYHNFDKTYLRNFWNISMKLEQEIQSDIQMGGSAMHKFGSEIPKKSPGGPHGAKHSHFNKATSEDDDSDEGLFPRESKIKPSSAHRKKYISNIGVSNSGASPNGRESIAHKGVYLIFFQKKYVNKHLLKKFDGRKLGEKFKTLTFAKFSKITFEIDDLKTWVGFLNFGSNMSSLSKLVYVISRWYQYKEPDPQKNPDWANDCF